jgi:FtsH-binding integral membrane protein
MPTTEAFWNQMGAYNQATLPVQITMIVAAAALTYLVFAKANARANALMKILLSFAFAWNGIVFFLIFAWSTISGIASALFIIIAVLFALDIFKKKTEFRLPVTKWQRYLTIFLIVLVFLYPLIGMALGHSYPQTCMPMAPCPLTVFAITLVAAAIPQVDRKTYVLLLPWAILSLPKCLGALDCYEDCILFAAGVYGLVLLVRNWKVIRRSQRDEQEFVI